MVRLGAIDGSHRPLLATRLSATRTVEAAVTEALRRRILTGDLGPGTLLLQADLAQQLGTSITPVRSALSELAGEGLVRAEPHHTMSVADPTPEELKEVYELRLLLEPASAATAADLITEDELEAAEQLLRRMEHVEDLGEWSSLNRDFHALLASASGSTRLTQVMLDLLGLSALHIRRISRRDVPGRHASASREHREILAAMRAHDRKRAYRSVLTHLKTSNVVYTAHRNGSRRRPSDSLPHATSRDTAR